MTRTTLTPIVAILLAASAAFAQDSARTIPKSIAFDVSAAHYYQESDVSDRSAFVSDHPAVRGIDSNGPGDEDFVTDNPLYHGATFAKLGALVTFVDGVTLDAEIVAEHRGISYGVYATEEMTIYPRMLLGLDTTFKIGGEPFRLISRVGNFTDLRWYEGLSFYNMDGQGSDFEIGWRWLRLWRRQIGDVNYGLGLGIGDVAEFGAGLLDVPLFDSLTADLQVGHINYLGTSYYTDESFNYSLGLQWGETARLYGEIGTRNAELGDVSGGSTGSLFGIDGRYGIGPVDLEGRVEWRDYGEGFNRARKSRVSYRSAGSTIGEFLYPLDYLERPFSQWALFTEYESAITGFTFQLDARVHLPYDFLLRAVLDFNELHAEGWSVDSYDFFDIGFGWEPVRGLSIIVSRTNRAMNLDRSYPTYYLYNDAVTAMSVRWNVP